MNIDETLKTCQGDVVSFGGVLSQSQRREASGATVARGNPCEKADRLFLLGYGPLYSSRSVLAGSILAILRVGTVVARSVTAESVSTTTSMVGASYMPTP